MLIKNQNRYVHDEEEEGEKVNLSLAILNFLKYVSRDSTISDLLN